MNQAPVQNTIVDPIYTPSHFITRVALFFLSLALSFFSYGQDSVATPRSDSVIPVNQKLSASEVIQGLHLSPKQKKQRQWLVAGVTVAAYGGSLFALQRAWYDDDSKTSFHTFDDSNEWLQVDKFGHACF